jgi:hypothetical protein
MNLSALKAKLETDRRRIENIFSALDLMTTDEIGLLESAMTETANLPAQGTLTGMSLQRPVTRAARGNGKFTSPKCMDGKYFVISVLNGAYANPLNARDLAKRVNDAFGSTMTPQAVRGVAERYTLLGNVDKIKATSARDVKFKINESGKALYRLYIEQGLLQG